ncbi:hypothetical protein [Nonomuraea monospora]|uniref:hypothetical protein n=1 Tax=Nonomuraea monospora TaxID=568818 RepID=UPI0031D90A72
MFDEPRLVEHLDQPISPLGFSPSESEPAASLGQASLQASRRVLRPTIDELMHRFDFPRAGVQRVRRAASAGTHSTPPPAIDDPAG